MSGIRTTTGLMSGLDLGGLVDALINAERAPVRRLESRLKNLQTVQTGLGQLQAQLLALSAATLKLSDRNTFSSVAVSNSDPQQLSVSARLNSITGTYQFQAVRLATSHSALSRGFASNTQQVGAAGQLVIASGGQLERPVSLDLLNDGTGVRRGIIRIQDRSGAVAQVDLRNAVTIGDVAAAINSQAAGVRAEVRNDRLQLFDLTGQTAAPLSVTDMNGGRTAQDLGLAQSVAANVLNGSSIFRVSDEFTLNLLNDGNGLRQKTGVDDLQFTLSDGTTLAVNLDGVATVGELLQKINGHPQNGGKLAATLQDNRLILTDTAGGSGTLQAANLSGSNAVEFLGLTGDAPGGVLTGQRLHGGLNSVLLRNLRGGQGITALGQLSLTDRTGAMATVDLSNAETLDDVLHAINTATTGGGAPVALRAELDGRGTGIVVRDTSGSTASPLIIADVGGNTLAADLGIAVNAEVTSVKSGSLALRRVNEATSLSTYSPRGTAVATGSFRIEDSSGQQAVINITPGVKTIGDVIDRINAAGGINVTARLNETGDGLVIIDDAGGTGTLRVTEVGGRTAADLRLLGAATVGDDGKQRVTSRRALIVDVAATDTLESLATKINVIGGVVRATVVNTGALLNGFRLSLNSTVAGDAGRFTVDDGSLGLNFTDQDIGRDAVLRVGADPATAYLKTSPSNAFPTAVAALDVTLLQAGGTPVTVTTSLDAAKAQAAVEAFVSAYNAYIDQAAELTKFDPATQTRSALQGSNATLLVAARFQSLVNRVSGGPDASIRSLADVGLRLTTGGKLKFDGSSFTAALRDHPQQVRTLFTDLNNGFGTQFNKALDAFTNAQTGTLTLQTQALQATADTITSRITQLDALLQSRRVRLERQFIQMETVLSRLQSQQTALNGLANMIAGWRASASRD
uniref:Filament cap protein n=1 Tax=Schlesneria paludicola TaxID=360056 RepID=A0A7C4QNT2_9PLAN